MAWRHILSLATTSADMRLSTIAFMLVIFASLTLPMLTIVLEIAFTAGSISKHDLELRHGAVFLPKLETSLALVLLQRVVCLNIICTCCD